jgi:hypothetical protein
MAHYEYYNGLVELNERFYDSHKSLLEKVSMELGCFDRFDELCEKFLQQPKLKAKVDPNAPKKPRSAFILYCDDERVDIIKNIKEKNIENKRKFNLGDVQKELGLKWSNISVELKEIYNNKSRDDKERYTKDYEEYQENIYGNIYNP